MDRKHILGWKKPDYGSNQKGTGRGGAATTQGIPLAILSKILHVSIFQKKCRQNSIRKIKNKNSIALPPHFLLLLPF